MKTFARVNMNGVSDSLLNLFADLGGWSPSSVPWPPVATPPGKR